MSNQTGVLIVMAKRPKLGQAKTRLAASVGNELALTFYNLMLAKTLQTAELVPYHTCIAATGEGTYSFPETFEVIEQVKGDLGRRMSSAFDYAFQNNKATSVVMIGTDCYELEPAIIKDAFRKLSTKDVVLGPSQDGGYYLIGMNELHEELFMNMTWSVETVLEETKIKLTSAGLSFAEVKELNDIDTLEDLKDSSLYAQVKHQLNEPE